MGQLAGTCALNPGRSIEPFRSRFEAPQSLSCGPFRRVVSSLALLGILVVGVDSANAQPQAQPQATGPTSEPKSSEASTASSADAQRLASLQAFRLQYAPIDLLLPSKWGAALQGEFAGESIELDYSSATVKAPWVLKDLGSMSESRIQLTTVRPIGRAATALYGWNFQWGLTYNIFKIKLGDSLLSRLSGGLYPNVDVVDLQTLGLVGAVGYRRLFGSVEKAHWGWGIDLFSWSQPLITMRSSSPFLDSVTNTDDREAVEQAMRLIRLFPRWTLGRVSVTYRF